MIVIAAMAAMLWIVGGLLKHWGAAVVVATLIGAVGTSAYYFHYRADPGQALGRSDERIGSRRAASPRRHLADDNLWDREF